MLCDAGIVEGSRTGMEWPLLGFKLGWFTPKPLVFRPDSIYRPPLRMKQEHSPHPGSPYQLSDLILTVIRSQCFTFQVRDRSTRFYLVPLSAHLALSMGTRTAIGCKYITM